MAVDKIRPLIVEYEYEQKEMLEENGNAEKYFLLHRFSGCLHGLHQYSL